MQWILIALFANPLGVWPSQAIIDFIMFDMRIHSSYTEIVVSKGLHS